MCTTVFFCGEGPRSRCYGRTAALRLIVQPCDEDGEKDDQFFNISKEWSTCGMKLTGENRNTRGKKICPSVHHKFHMGRTGIEPGPLSWEAGD